MTYARRKELTQFIEMCKLYPTYYVKRQLRMTDAVFKTNLREARYINLINDVELVLIKVDKVFTLQIENLPYSGNEDDYINLKERNVFITKEGIIDFNGNNPLKPVQSLFHEAAQQYKSVTQIHNI